MCNLITCCDDETCLPVILKEENLRDIMVNIQRGLMLPLNNRNVYTMIENVCQTLDKLCCVSRRALEIFTELDGEELIHDLQLKADTAGYSENYAFVKALHVFDQKFLKGFCGDDFFSQEYHDWSGNGHGAKDEIGRPPVDRYFDDSNYGQEVDPEDDKTIDAFYI